jgi:hypothetical protein
MELNILLLVSRLRVTTAPPLLPPYTLIASVGTLPSLHPSIIMSTTEDTKY